MVQERKPLESTIIEMKNDFAQKDKEKEGSLTKAYSKFLNIEKYCHVL